MRKHVVRILTMPADCCVHCHSFLHVDVCGGCAADTPEPLSALTCWEMLQLGGWHTYIGFAKDGCCHGLRVGFCGADIAHVAEAEAAGQSLPKVRLVWLHV